MSTSSALAYFFSSFPSLSMTFLQREVRDLRAQRQNVALFANRRPKLGDFDPQDMNLYADTFYLYPIRPIRLLKANLKLIVTRPGAYKNALHQALRLHDGFNLQRLRNLARLFGAAVIAERLSALKINHLHVHFAFGAAGVALLLKTLLGITYSISIHGSDVLIPQPLIRQKLGQARFIISNCRFHIEHLKKEFPELGDQRFYHLPLGIDLSHPPWSSVCEVASPPPLRILSVARFNPIKNHALLLNALAQLKANQIVFRCRLVGEGPTRSKMMALATSLKLDRQVTFLGPLTETAVAQQMDWAHVVVLSSFSEGTPMTLIEAMAKKRAVVAPDITGIPELVVHEETGLLYPCNDQDRLIACLQKLADNPNLIRHMGNQGHWRARGQFDINRHTRNLITIFQQERMHD
ncbi:colanic acid biosynthesis glycosyltransferase WcaL [Desulfosarcina ovata subsp. sediminis]|uniref:Colanic acid biosynthesis glycosyltransferase WcaL n=1 Tax=Desulfosarcina ovata subsp. sediminis TaxID=885957 RepID=A0A5K7ZG66_9BACT|nr:glycosyltransferase [Desulfosarcina ovata]BBO80324.1 colanic acid biosynthesis glycosyltransferase WcaL [Desulfosarcina ovata subsp. sediminis]